MATVFHTTGRGNAAKIEREGFKVFRSTPALYGRGVYFWELEIDAHSYGEFGEKAGWLPTGWDVVRVSLSVTPANSLVYPLDDVLDPQQANWLTEILLEAGKEVMIIPNPRIERTTHRRAKGRAFCFLCHPTHD